MEWLPILQSWKYETEQVYQQSVFCCTLPPACTVMVYVFQEVKGRQSGALTKCWVSCLCHGSDIFSVWCLWDDKVFPCVTYRCSMNVLNSSGQTALDIANFWNHSDASSALSDGAVIPTQECRNYYSLNPLNRASDRRKHPEWIHQSVRRDNTKFILFSDLNPFLIEDTNQKSKKSKYVLGLFSYNQLAEHIAKKPLLIFLGLETWDPESAVWFAVDVTGVEESKLKDVHKDGFFANPLPLTMQMDDRHAGIFAEARSILTWHDRYSFCATCGSSTVVQEAGYKRVCGNADCRSHKGEWAVEETVLRIWR